VTTIRSNSAAKLRSEPLADHVGIVEYFVHPTLRGKPDVLYRTRVLIGLLLVFAAIFASACLVLPFTAMPLLNQTLGIGICFSSFLGTCALLLHLQRHGSYHFCSEAAGLLIAMAVVIGIGLSGGVMQSSATQLLMVPPLLAYFFGSLRAGNQALLLSLLVVLLFMSAQYAGVPFPQTIGTERDLKTVQLLVCFINVLAVSAMAFTYELTAVKLKNERDREHHKALVLAQTDGLTGLANRRSIDNCLKQRIERYGAMQPPRPFVICCVDLDGFKPINDQYGHKIGDEVLYVVSERLRLSFRGNDVVGRHGGDEFIAIFDAVGCVPGASGSNIGILAEHMLYMIAKPIETSAGRLQVGASLGFAIYPHDGRSAETLTRAADSAMYEAKSSGGSAWRVFQPSMNPTQPMEETLSSSSSATIVTTASAAPDVPPAMTQGGIKARLTALVDTFIHPSLRIESDRMRRARILVMALLVYFGIVFLADAVLMAIPLPPSSKFMTNAICTPNVVIMALLLVSLRRIGNYSVCSAAMVLTVYFTVLASICVSGGGGVSCATQLMAAAPLIAYFFGGVRWGTGMVIASLAAIIVFALLEMTKFHFSYALDAGQTRMIQVVVGIVGLVFSSGMAFSYELAARNLKRERDEEHKVVERFAHTDALTGLANRFRFDEALDLRVRRAKASASNACFTLCCLDLNGFKPINDRYGHNVGDEVLKVVAERLRRCVRDSDIAGRHGGDEFMLLLDGVRDEAQIKPIAQCVLSALATPIMTPAGELSIHGSLGFASFPDDGYGADALKNAADKAMYAAKSEGGGWKLYRSEFHQPASSLRRRGADGSRQRA
jgi:diguanylate cyclase (GGDEF)-like protein